MTVCRQRLEFPGFFWGWGPGSGREVFGWFVLPVGDGGGIRKDSCRVLLARLVSREAILFLS